MDIFPPALQTRYQITRLLGQGGFAAVYLAWDTHLNRQCAIKENRIATPQAQRQFEREAKLLAQLRHPNLPRVIDHFALPGQGQYLVMDFIEGEDLLQLLHRRGQPLEERDALAYILPVCDALIYLHHQDPPIIHRDVKPQNIILSPGGLPYLVDFGIAKTFSPHTGTTLGARAVSSGYSPPEQYGQSPTDERSDLYAVAATLYTLLTNYTPPDSLDVMTGAAPPAPPVQALNSRVSSQTSAAIERAMQLERRRRYPDMQTFCHALADQPLRAAHPRPGVAPGEHPPNKTPPRRASTAPWGFPLALGVGALGLLGIILLIWLLANTDRRPTVAAAGTLENLNQASATFTQAAPLPSTPGAGGLPSNPSPSPDAPTPSPVIQASDTPLPSPTLFRTHVDDAPMIVIPAVEFRMGMRNNVTQWHVDLCNQFSNCNAVDYEDAMPAHTVAVSKFRLDAHEVTNRQYAACVAAQVCPPIQPGALADYLPAAYVNALEYAEYPAVGVTWDSANLYCNWVGKRLPTEAEWERAASGDGSALFPWGDPPAEDVLNLGLMFGDAGPLMNYCDAKCQFAWHDLDNDDGWAGPAPVMSYPPNFMGLYDLAGNAQEWVLDFYDASFYAYSAAFNPVNTTPSACPNRSELNGHVVRGGGWNNGAYHATSRYRLCSEAWQAKAYRGFRCAAP